MVDLRRHRHTESRRELLGISFGCSAHGDPENHPEIHMLRALIPALKKEEMDGTNAPPPMEGKQYPEIAFEGKSLCSECLSYVQGYLRREFLEQCQMQFHIRDMEKKLEKESETDSQLSFEKELNSLLESQANLLSEINQVAREREWLSRETEEIEKEEMFLDSIENSFWRDLSLTKSAFTDIAEKRDSLLNRIHKAEHTLRELGPVHACNDAFFIWRDGEYGTINGFRLGQLLGISRSMRRTSAKPELKQPPEWEEINTGWGLSAMLLSAIAQSCNFEFAGFKIEPMGSRTTILHLTGPRTALDFIKSTIQPGRYALYLDVNKSNTVLDRLGGFIATRNTAVESFNKGMRAFLVCLHQLSAVAIQSSYGKQLGLEGKMYSIEIPDEQNYYKDIPPGSAKINKNIVDLQHSPTIVASQQRGSEFDQDDQNSSMLHFATQPTEGDIENSYRWTVALRHILTNLKWLLVWSVKEKKAQHVL